MQTNSNKFKQMQTNANKFKQMQTNSNKCKQNVQGLKINVQIDYLLFYFL